MLVRSTSSRLTKPLASPAIIRKARMQPCDRMRDARLLGRIFAAVLLLGAICASDLASRTVRHWWSDHAVIADVVSSAAVVAVTVIAVEELMRRARERTTRLARANNVRELVDAVDDLTTTLDAALFSYIAGLAEWEAQKARLPEGAIPHTSGRGDIAVSDAWQALSDYRANLLFLSPALSSFPPGAEVLRHARAPSEEAHDFVLRAIVDYLSIGRDQAIRALRSLQTREAELVRRCNALIEHPDLSS